MVSKTLFLLFAVLAVHQSVVASAVHLDVITSSRTVREVTPLDDGNNELSVPFSHQYFRLTDEPTQQQCSPVSYGGDMVTVTDSTWRVQFYGGPTQRATDGDKVFSVQSIGDNQFQFSPKSITFCQTDMPDPKVVVDRFMAQAPFVCRVTPAGDRPNLYRLNCDNADQDLNRQYLNPVDGPCNIRTPPQPDACASS